MLRVAYNPETGRVTVLRLIAGDHLMSDMPDCTTCHGKGKMGDGSTCKSCGGTGMQTGSGY